MSTDFLAVALLVGLLGMVVIMSAHPGISLLKLILIAASVPLFWGHLVPRLPLHLPWMLGLGTWVVAFWVLWAVANARRASLRGKSGLLALWSGGVIAVTLMIQSLSDSVLVQILGWGHDNAALLALIRANAACGGFLFLCQSEAQELPSYLTEYPQGFSVAWASIPGAFGTDTYLQALRPYAFLLLVVSLMVIALTGMLASYLSTAGRRGSRAISGVAAGLVVGVGVWSHQFWSGFASYLWATLIILTYVTLREGSSSRSTNWPVWAAMALVSTYYSHQLLTPFLVAYISVDMIAHRGQLWTLVRRTPGSLLCTSLLVVVLIALAPRSAQGSGFLDQLVVEGGMEAIPVWVSVPLAITASLVLFAALPVDHVALRWAMLIGLVVFFAMAVITIRTTGYISYYPMKFLYLLVLFMIAATAALLVSKPFATARSQLWFSTAGLIVLILAILPPLLRFPGFKTPYQGSTPAALRALISNPFGGAVTLCGPFVMEAVDRLGERSGRVEVYRDGLLLPLETRWINLMRNEWNDEAWRNEEFQRPLSETRIPSPLAAIVSHTELPAPPKGLDVLVLGEPCDLLPLPPFIPVG